MLPTVTNTDYYDETANDYGDAIHDDDNRKNEVVACSRVDEMQTSDYETLTAFNTIAPSHTVKSKVRQIK
jgi:hypothetical protein